MQCIYRLISFRALQVKKVMLHLDEKRQESNSIKVSSPFPPFVPRVAITLLLHYCSHTDFRRNSVATVAMSAILEDRRPHAMHGCVVFFEFSSYWSRSPGPLDVR